ncbi:MAG TPA: carbohydrate ABC transporter permease [Acidimicrobiales bacterium]|nr:carbohydrate ABC transporter permease [Acidimicrobiales bacterium]
MNVAVFLTVLFVLVPLYFMVVSSFKNPNTIGQSLQLWPAQWTVKNYTYVWTASHFGRNILNSLIVSVCSTILVLALGSMAGYALGRLPMRGKLPILMTLLMISVFPVIGVIAPLYVVLRTIGWLNSYQALILPYTAFNLPFAIWILRNYFLGIPREMEETGRIDGASPMRTLVQIIMPQAAPGLFTAAVFCFTACWTEYLMALSFDSNTNMHTIPVAIGSALSTIYTVPYGPYFAASCMAAVPIGILVLVFRKSVVSGLTSGAVKG